MVAILVVSSVSGLMPAAAHVTVSPDTAPADSYAKLTFRVAHGCEGSPTVRVRVQIPDGLVSVRPMVHPLWKVSIVKKPLATPYESHGKMITETVGEVVWAEGSLPDGLMDEFSLSVKLPNQPGQTVTIPVVQECEKGVYRWIQVAQPGEDPDSLEEPAPLLKLTEVADHTH
ncbi:MAG: YcnI family protein [Synechococcales cyanobacterium]